ncbi:MAG: hypothetical protein ACFFF9_06875 [Candidatus Thorarchaeota archaeon]
MSIQSKLEALSYICFAGMIIGFIMTVGYSLFIWYLFTMAMLAVFSIVLIVTIYFGLRDHSLETRKMPWWSNIGVFIMGLGIFLYTFPEIGIISTLTGVIVVLYGIFYKENRNYEKINYGAEGEI